MGCMACAACLSFPGLMRGVPVPSLLSRGGCGCWCQVWGLDGSVPPPQLEPLDPSLLQQKPNVNAVATLEKVIEIQSETPRPGTHTTLLGSPGGSLGLSLSPGDTGGSWGLIPLWGGTEGSLGLSSPLGGPVPAMGEPGGVSGEVPVIGIPGGGEVSLDCPSHG